MKKIFFGIGLIAIIAKISGFARELALSYFFGASEVTDAYLISLTIPTVIFNFINIIGESAISAILWNNDAIITNNIYFFLLSFKYFNAKNIIEKAIPVLIINNSFKK